MSDSEQREGGMTASFPISAPDLVRRRVLFAVALVDPMTGALVSEGMRVDAAGLVGKPIVNASGNFVWLAEGAARPDAVTVTPEGRPFEPETRNVAPIPDPPAEDPLQPAIPIDQTLRRLRILLRPTPAYPFPDGVTVLHGRLQETAAANAPRVAGAAVEPQWKDSLLNWNASIAAGLTTASGEFRAALLLPPGARADGGPQQINARLVFTRGALRRATPEALVTPGTTLVAPGTIPPPPGTPDFGVLAWDQLVPA
jgi:hypothetical protein